MLCRCVAAVLVTLFAGLSALSQCRPTTGCASAVFAEADQAMLDLMCENDIPGATLAVAYNGVVVYERGYGWSDRDRTVPMQPDAMMRIASISKPLTVAAARRLIEFGTFDLDDFAFDLGQRPRGLLRIEPFPSLGDPRLAEIRVEHLIKHTAGWNRDIAGDLTFKEIEIAADMGVDSPPGRERTIAWILGQPLQTDPGETKIYSNIGATVLALIIEAGTKRPVEEVIQRLVLHPIRVDDDDHIAGRTKRDDQDPREPWYSADQMATDVFDPRGEPVERPYGGWDHEARVGHGGQVTTAAVLARFAAHYWVNGPNIGKKKEPRLRGSWRWNHGGILEGTGTTVRQLGSGVTYAVLFNSRGNGGAARDRLDPIFDGIGSFPTRPPRCD
ncbi:MAG: serine hydrolase domain-containing protein [Planctomycetota bacterium]